MLGKRLLQMAAVTGRKFFEELGQLVGKPVVVEEKDGKTYAGTLLGFDTQSMSVVLGEAKSTQGATYHKMILTGNVIAKIMATDTPFNLEALKARLERVFPNMVQFVPEVGILIVMSKIRLNETGVIEGTGPAASRVQDIYNRFIQETS